MISFVAPVFSSSNKEPPLCIIIITVFVFVFVIVEPRTRQTRRVREEICEPTNSSARFLLFARDHCNEPRDPTTLQHKWAALQCMPKDDEERTHKRLAAC